MGTSAHLVNICGESLRVNVDEEQLRQGILLVLQEHQVKQAVIGLAIVTDAAIQKMNRQYLNHDYPTDVLSFPLSSNSTELLEGEIAISFDTAQQRAKDYEWSTQNELLLYAIHGTLHLVGFLDKTLEERQEMRHQEKEILEKMNIIYPGEMNSVAGDATLQTAPGSDSSTRSCSDTSGRTNSS